ncbi:LacI family DNA-binding transcriptional regulator [Ktedonospora formicarum]|uniref:LacI family transcriptional regulator n=1 Tax=Ktedonospora formicarum TaxID=2778364 RepID=A0A8J3MTT9_9CHLR|nr:LacI family DNA-binding transcriptional regulator [Ktedonospora formicarum]GHO45958.1 LacI family transcriptional regulator [Ktedonospora formicarum]
MVGKLTIQDIARLAGVSKATVSRVLNAKPDVDPATRERILQIMQEQGFVPNVAASSLAGGRSRLIGVVIPPLTWPLITEILRGVSEVVEQSSYELLLYSVAHDLGDYEKNKGTVIDRILASHLASGLLAVYPGSSIPHLTKLYDQGFPVVIIDDRETPTHVPWVSADNQTGAAAATRYLLQLGHRRIAFIQGPLEYEVSLKRYQGFCEALKEAGLTPDPELVQQGNFMAKSGLPGAKQFFTMEKRPTAIFAGNDQMAYDVLEDAEAHGVRIPGDISLIGFDDIPSSAYTRPALTSVRQPFYEMGRRATELLLSQLDAPRPVPTSYYPAILPLAMQNTSANYLQLPTELIVRASCTSPR